MGLYFTASLALCQGTIHRKRKTPTNGKHLVGVSVVKAKAEWGKPMDKPLRNWNSLYHSPAKTDSILPRLQATSKCLYG